MAKKDSKLCKKMAKIGFNYDCFTVHSDVLHEFWQHESADFVICIKDEAEFCLFDERKDVELVATFPSFETLADYFAKEFNCG